MRDETNKNMIKVPEAEKKPSWIPTIIMFCIGLWPVGALLLFGNLRTLWRISKNKAYRQYAVVIGFRPFVQISELVRTIGKPEQAVRAELQEMIDKGYMGKRAYIDRATNCVVVDPDRKPESESKRARHAQSAHYVREERYVREEWQGDGQAQPAQAQTESPSVSEFKPQAQATAATPGAEKPSPAPEQKSAPQAPQEDEFERILRQIRDLNDRIDNVPVSDKIDRIGEITANIFHFVKQKPDRRDEVHKFMSYYLPTTMKLLESYSLLEKQSYQGENIVAARKDIENILGTMVSAFEKQLDRLFQADAIDISADIDVLETMMAKDGLTEKDGMTLRMGGR